jgi:hypothetical protein
VRRDTQGLDGELGYGTKISSHTQGRDGVCELIIQEKLYKTLIISSYCFSTTEYNPFVL